MEIKLKNRIPAHAGAIYAFYFDRVEKKFFTGSGDGTVVQWDLENPSDAKVVARINSNILSLLYIPGSKTLYTGTLPGGVHILDLESKKESRHITFHQKGVFDILIKDKKLFLAGGDGVLSTWEEEGFEPHGAFKISEQSLRSMDFQPSGDELAVGSSDHSIYILDAETMAVKHRLSGHKNSVFKVKYSPDGKRLLSGSRDAHLGVWDTENNYSQMQFIPAHNYTINDLAFSEDGKSIATASRDKSIKIWNSEDASFLKKLEAASDAHTNSVNRVFWNGNYLYSGGDDRSLIIWEIL